MKINIYFKFCDKIYSTAIAMFIANRNRYFSVTVLPVILSIASA